MGSFNSAPKINNSDSQDDSLEVPKGLSTSELLQHCKHLRGENQPPLLTRFFLKPLSTLTAQTVSSDITDGFRCLKLDTISRGLHTFFDRILLTYFHLKVNCIHLILN